MKNELGNFYIIAVNLFDSTKNKILLQTQEVLDAEISMLVNLNNFIGKGYEICNCKKIDFIEEAEDKIIQINIGKTAFLFEVISIVKIFPLIEGKFIDGIYELDSDGKQYFEVNNKSTLSNVLGSLFDYVCSEEFKVVCEEDSITLLAMPEGKVLEKIVRQPKDFFDEYCPICHSKVITYKKESHEYPQCVLVKMPCPHFIGNIIHFFNGYEKKSLDKFGLNYQTYDNELYFEVSKNRLEKAIIYIPPQSPNHYWNKLSKNTNKVSEDHIIYVKR